MRAGSALQAEYRLHEQRRFHHALFEEIVQVVEMRGVVAFEFKARASLRQRLQDVFDVLEGIAEHDVLVLEMLALPFMLEFLKTVEHAEECKIHRSHVERSDF